MSDNPTERIDRLAHTLSEKNAEIETLRTSLAAAKTRADDAMRAQRDEHETATGLRRQVAAAAILREDLARAREAEAAAKHELKVARELAPPDETQIIAALREAYDAKEAELRAELAGALEVIAEDEPQAREDQTLVAALRRRLELDEEHDTLEALGEVLEDAERTRGQLAETQENLEERQAWANATQGELDDIAELLGLPTDAPHGRVRDAIGALLQRAEIAEQQEARAREAEAAALAARDEARLGVTVTLAEAPTEGARERLAALAQIALKLGLRRNAKADVILEAFTRAELAFVMNNDDRPHLERLLVALWPGRNVHDAETTPTLEAVPDAAERIAELRELADDWANDAQAAPATNGYAGRLIEAMLARVEAGESDPDFLDRVERIAGLSC